MVSKQTLASIKKLQQKKYREESGTFIVEGWKSVEEALKAGIVIETVLYDEQQVENTQLLTKLQHSASEVLAVKTKELQSISDTVNSQGIIAVIPKLLSDKNLRTILQQQSALVVVLDGINDPGNLGTIIRTCDWFGVDALMIGERSVEVYNPKVVRASMGSLFHLPIIDNVDVKHVLASSKMNHFTIYSTELSKSEDIRTISFSRKSMIIIGSEAHGVSPEVSGFADQKIHVPQFGKAESLNAAMACGIILSRIKL